MGFLIGFDHLFDVLLDLHPGQHDLAAAACAADAEIHPHPQHFKAEAPQGCFFRV